MRRTARSPRRFAWFRSFCPVFSKLEMTNSYMFFSYSRMLVLGCSLLPCFGVAQIHECMPNHRLCKARRSSTSKFLHQRVKGLYFKKGCRIFSNGMKKCLETVISPRKVLRRKLSQKSRTVSQGGVISVVTVFQQQDMDCILLSHHPSG